MPIAFEYDPTIISSITCQIWNSFSYGLDALSPWSLVYISVEKYISIAYPSKRFIFKGKNTQIIYMIVLIIFNIIYHINIPFSYDLIVVDNTTYCGFINNEWQSIISFMDLANCALIPFLLMLFFSILLIKAIFKSRSRINLNNTVRENKRLKKDIKFAISLLLMLLYLLFLIFILPIDIDQFLAFYDNYDLFNIFYYIFYISYAVNFYIILLTNSIFRKESFNLFFKKINKQKNNGTHLVLNQICGPAQMRRQIKRS
jgi:uncharacterized oligopeptide transporter (OPT) family protein